MTTVKAEIEGRASAEHELAEFARVPNRSVPEGLAPGGDRFALRVTNDALADDGIREGDLLLLDAHRHAANGETVVAVVNGKASVRRLYREADGTLRLEAQSKNLPPIFAREVEVEVRGRVIALIRKYASTNP